MLAAVVIAKTPQRVYAASKALAAKLQRVCIVEIGAKHILRDHDVHSRREAPDAVPRLDHLPAGTKQCDIEIRGRVVAAITEHVVPQVRALLNAALQEARLSLELYVPRILF